MKTLIATTAVILGFAAPVFAQTQLEAQLGVPAGAYSTSELARIAFADDDTGNEAVVFFGSKSNATVSSKSTANARAAEIFHGLDLADDSLNRATLSTTGTVYTSGAVNARADAIFADLRANEDDL